MRDFLIDTQTIQYWYDDTYEQHAAVIGNIESLREQVKPLEHKPKLLVSVVTLGEIEYGHRVQTKGSGEKQRAYLRFVHEELPATLELMEDAVKAYGEIRGRLFNKYAPTKKRRHASRPEQLTDPSSSLELQIQENDLWLCAQAVGHGMVLVTNDRMCPIREVCDGMEPNLLVQNWVHVGEANPD